MKKKKLIKLIKERIESWGLNDDVPAGWERGYQAGAVDALKEVLNDLING